MKKEVSDEMELILAEFIKAGKPFTASMIYKEVEAKFGSKMNYVTWDKMRGAIQRKFRKFFPEWKMKQFHKTFVYYTSDDLDDHDLFLLILRSRSMPDPPLRSP